MTPAFKHRLLGTIILVLAGVIFLPDLLDGEKQVVKDDFKVIPTRPEFQGTQQPKLFDHQAHQAQKQLATQQATTEEDALDETPAVVPPPESQTETLPSQQYATVTAGAPAASSSSGQTNTTAAKASVAGQAAWVVRVGSFSNEQNAKALVVKLQNAGYTAFTRPVTNAQGRRLTSVLVGPDLRKNQLESQLTKLQQLTGVEKLHVSSYQPVENN